MPNKTTKYILVVGLIPTVAVMKYRSWIKQYQKDESFKVKLLLLHDKQVTTKKDREKIALFDEVIVVNFEKDNELHNSILPYSERLLAVVCRSESYIPALANIVPHVPYNRLPTAESLRWSINKLQMRRKFRVYNSKITPKYRLVKNLSEAELDAVEKKLSYPLVVKPFGLVQSLLVTNVYHRAELKSALKKVFSTMDKIYAENEKVSEQGVLVEELMEGNQYSIDCYVNSRGKVYYCPIVHVKTGKQIGFDDYFGYRQMTPTKLKKSSEEKAQQASHDAIHALGLRSTTAHVELIRTEEGWKVIEVGPRVGGFREELYEYSYGINHAINDLLIRMGKKPVITRTIKGYSAGMKLYAHMEGEIVSVQGIKKIQKLESFVKLTSTPKRKGDQAIYAKNGGKSIVNLFLHNKDRSRLLADIRRLEQMFKVIVTKK